LFSERNDGSVLTSLDTDVKSVYLSNITSFCCIFSRYIQLYIEKYVNWHTLCDSSS